MMLRNSFIKKRKGSGILLSVIAAAFVSGLIGVSIARLHGISFGGLASVSESMQAQQVAANLAESIRAAAYLDTNKMDRQAVPGLPGFYQTISMTKNGVDTERSFDILIDNGDASNPIVSLKIDRLKVSEKLYSGKGFNSDGAMTQKAVTDALNELEAKNKAQINNVVNTIATDIYFAEDNGTPIGTIIAWNSPKTPNKNGTWLLMDGRTFNANDFKELYNLLGTNKLPNTQGKFLEGTLGAPGGEHQAGLPNITAKWSAGESSSYHDGELSASGAVYATGEAWYRGNSGSRDSSAVWAFDASRSSSIYGKSLTVQPESLIVRYYIKALNNTTKLAADNSIAKTTFSIVSGKFVNSTVTFSDGSVLSVPAGTSNSITVLSSLYYNVVIEPLDGYQLVGKGITSGDISGRCYENVAIVVSDAVEKPPVPDDPDK